MDKQRSVPSRTYHSLRRSLGRLLARPLELPGLNTPTLVFGSAPKSNPPSGFSDDWSLITINGSHGILARLLNRRDLEADLTLMMHSHPVFESPNSKAVHDQLAGLRCKTMLFVGGSKRRQGIALAESDKMNYPAANKIRCTASQRQNVIRQTLLPQYDEVDLNSKVSNGIFAVCLALASGSKPIVIAGISPDSSGHAYTHADGKTLARKHQAPDTMALAAMASSGLPIFAADEALAAKSGLQLWSDTAYISNNTGV